MSGFPFVLMYHSVGAVIDDPHRLTVTPERLDAHLRALRRQALRGMSVRELVAAGGRGVGLTFDDGYADFVEVAVPILRRHGCTATVFVLPGRLGGDNAWDRDGARKPLMTAEHVRAAKREGMEIGSHGLRHVHLPLLDEAGLHDEVHGSRATLEAITASPVTGLAYPYGDLGRREIDAARAAGYSYACAVDLRPTPERPAALRASLHSMPRSYAGQRDGALRLLAKRTRHRFREVTVR